MKKATLSLIVLVLMLLGAVIAWACYLDWLALALFILSFTPSSLLDEGLQEIKNQQTNA